MFEGFRGEKHHKNRKTENGRETLGSKIAGYAGIYRTIAVAKENPCGVANC